MAKPEGTGMVIVDVFAGLGNQLFMYAAAKSLAQHHGTCVKLDIRGNWNPWRKFGLHHFNTDIKLASAEEIASVRPSLIRRLASRLGVPDRQNRASYYREPHFHFDPHFFKTPSDCYLHGYFQSCRYFESIEKILRQEFVIQPRFIQHLNEKATELGSGNSVAVHIRRGDYVGDRQYWVLDKHYYVSAVSFLRSRIKNLRIYYFSDDPRWVREHMTGSDLSGEIISGQCTKSNIEDLFLMSRCTHNIIANSTFSWWGAWLNEHPNRQVVAPKRWFQTLPHNTKDLIPVGWYIQ